MVIGGGDLAGLIGMAITDRAIIARGNTAIAPGIITAVTTALKLQP